MVGAVEIALTGGCVALIDDQDYDLVRQYKWRLYEDVSGNRYAIAKGPRPPGKKWQQDIRMHRLIAGAQSGQVVDHRDGDGLNNRRENLRLATYQQNNHHRRPSRTRNSSRFKGVSKDQAHGCFVASIYHGGKTTSLGYYDQEEAAARAYDFHAQHLFGEFAWLNFPGELLCEPVRRKCECGRCRWCRARAKAAAAA